jgi:hypothetical protein
VEKQPAPPPGLLARYPLYVKLGYAMVVMFGLLGNCTGHAESAVLVLVITSACWVCTRIITEAIEAWRVLLEAKKLKDKDNEPPAPR